MQESIEKYLKSDDPLSSDAFNFLVNYKEEDQRIDYKLDFDFNSEQEWIEITKDFISFANTYGGYLVFGVKDSSFQVNGLDEDTIKILTNTNLLRQKINRYIEPAIELIRSKSFDINGNNIVIVFIPETISITHVVSKDGIFKYPSGKSKTVLLKGTIYVRKSAGNKVATSRDIDELYNKRLEIFRNSLLSKITKVVEAPSTTKVLIVSKDETDKDSKKFIIEDAPDSIPVKGMSFSIAPQTTEQEIAGWKSMNERDPLAIPPEETIWKYYIERDNISLSEDYKLALVKFSILNEVPFFFWLRNCSAKNIKKMILESLVELNPTPKTSGFLKLAAFLGKKYFDQLLKKYPKHVERMSPGHRNFPKDNPKILFYHANIVEHIKKFKTTNKNKIHPKLLNELNDLCSKILNSPLGRPGPFERNLIIAIDCELFSQEDIYQERSTRKERIRNKVNKSNSAFATESE